MTLEKAHKLADTVLACLELLFEDAEADGCSRTYHNGRENGYVVNLREWTSFEGKIIELVKMKPLGRTVFFSEHRIWDGIICYRDEEGHTDGLTDLSCENTMSFDRHEAAKAAKAIFEWLKDGKVDERTPHPDYKTYNEEGERPTLQIKEEIK